MAHASYIRNQKCFQHELRAHWRNVAKEEIKGKENKLRT